MSSRDTKKEQKKIHDGRSRTFGDLSDALPHTKCGLMTLLLGSLDAHAASGDNGDLFVASRQVV